MTEDGQRPTTPGSHGFITRWVVLLASGVIVGVAVMQHQPLVGPDQAPAAFRVIFDGWILLSGFVGILSLLGLWHRTLASFSSTYSKTND